MKNNRKGFTITELVIVIVVIAILAAVLIPTFASLVKKANQSADIQAARQMNAALAAESAVEAPESLQEVIAILEAAGYDAEGALKPITNDHKFYWYKTYNTIILVNEAEGVEQPVVYPDKDKDIVDNYAADKAKTGDAAVLFDLEAGFRQFVKVEVESADDVLTALNKGQSVTLTQDVTLAKPVTIPEGSSATVNLNGNTLATTESSPNRHDYAINNEGDITIENGTFDARGVQNWGKMTIKEDVVVNSVDSNGGACIWNYAGSELVIDGGTFNIAGAPQNELTGATVVYNNGGTVIINDGTFKSTVGKGPYAIQNHNGGTMTINGGTFVSDRGLFCNGTNSTMTINGGKFTSNWVGNSAYVFYAGGGTLTWNGGSVTANDVTYVACEDGGTFVNNSGVTLVKNGSYYAFK